MRRALIVLLIVSLVALGVWHAVTRFSRQETASSGGATVADSPVIALPSLLPGSCGVHCGTERWAVKTLSDTDRERVDLRPREATVETLVGLERPAYLPPDGRADPVELAVYRVRARLLYVLGERDRDWHLVLQGLDDPAATLIAEVPDPQCAGSCNSGLAAAYVEIYALFERWVREGREAQPIVIVTGVGFFDAEHGQRGAAPNNFELHPVLRVEFR